MKTFRYISSLILCMLVVYSAQAQKVKIKAVPDSIKVPFFNGIFVQGDVASVASSFFSKGETYSYEASVQADIKHKLLPVIEFGYAGADKTTTDNVGFKTNGYFERFGLDLNVLTHKKDSKPTSNLFLVGLRLGMSNFKYNIYNLTVTDDYWGGLPVNTNYNNIATTKTWYELAVGVRVEVWKNIFMGWTVRSKTLISKDKDGAPTPWYIPGFGINNTGSSLGINYTIGYKFHLPTKKKPLHKEKQSAIVVKE